MSSPIAMRVRCLTPAATKENRTDQITCPFRRGRNSTHPAHWFASALSSLLQQVRLPSLSPSLISKGAGFSPPFGQDASACPIKHWSSAITPATRKRNDAYRHGRRHLGRIGLSG